MESAVISSAFSESARYAPQGGALWQPQGSRTTPQGRGQRNKAEPAHRRVVLPLSLVELNQFCDQDDLIYSAELRLAKLALDAPDQPWCVRWLDSGRTLLEYVGLMEGHPPAGSEGMEGMHHASESGGGTEEEPGYCPLMHNHPAFRQWLLAFMKRGRILLRR